MAHDASQNNPLKESLMAVSGLVLLLVIIGGIAVSAWLRPAGEHQPAQAAEVAAAEEQAQAVSEPKAEAEQPKADTETVDAQPEANK